MVKRMLISLFVLILLLTACGGPAAPTAAPAATKAPAAGPTAASVATTIPAAAPTAALIATTAPAAPTAILIPAATKAPAAPAAPSATSAPAAAPASAGSAKDAVIAAMLAQLKAGPYRTKTTIVSDNGTINLTGEMIPPDKLHTIMKGTNFERETIVVGDKSWIKQAGAWAVSPVAGKVLLESAFPALTAEQLSGTISDAKAAGTDAVNGEEARVYTYTSTTDLGQTGKVISAVKLWVSVKRGLPIKQEIAGDSGGVKSNTVQMIEYDPAITITAPM
jgi:hypothetical protein